MNKSILGHALAVVGALAAGCLFAADTLPAAPDLAAPPTFAEARLWLDAWDYSTFQTDANGFVTNWLGKSAAAGGAATYEAAELGTVGVTNGVPAYLMGDVGSGIDLQFDYMSDVRTVFWVMDALPYVTGDTEANNKAMGVELLACSVAGAPGSFTRNTPDAFFLWSSSAAFAGRFWLGDKYLFTWNQRRWSARNNPDDTKGLQVYALASDKDLHADRLSAVRGYEGAGDGQKNGGRALSELVIFNRTLPNGEVLMVKSYLNAKYKGIAPQTVDAETTPSEVTGYGDLTLGANAAFVLTDAVLDAERAAPVNVWGKFDKTAAGKIRLVYHGHVYNRRQALFCVGKGGLTLDDFEVTGLPADAELSCDGQTLWLRRTGAVLASAVLADTSANGPKLWLDASKADSFVFDDANGNFLRWRDQSPNHNDATNYVFNGNWYNPTVGVTNGVPALVMGKAGSGADLAFNRMDDIRTVFWAMDIEQNRGAHFLGFYTNGWTALPDPVDGYTEHRRQAYMRSINGRTVGGVARSGFFMFCTTNSVFNGEMLEDGVFPQDTAPRDTGDDRLRWVAPHEGLHVFSHRVKDDVPAWANNLGRCRVGTSTYSAGKNLSELVIFNRSLTDGEIAEVTAQLRAKWQGHAAATKLVAETTIDAPCAYAALVMDRESTALNVETQGSFRLLASALTADQPAITVFGEFRRGDIAQCTFTWAGDEIAPGDYALLTCANRFNCEPADFVFTGFPDNAYLYWRGTTLMMTVADAVTPLVPDALTAVGEAAPWLWLDAADAATFTTNQQGGVLAWADKGARGNDAKAYTLGDTPVYGTVGVTNGVAAYLMGDVGSCIDLAFPRTTAARTLFWVMDIALSRNADFLGDTTAQNFVRGKGGQYSGYATAQKGWTDGTILEDGDVPHDKTAHPEYKNYQLKPYAPPSVHVYSLQAGADMAADCLSAEQGSATVNGGRALSELVVFNRALTAFELGDVEAYLDFKWRGKTVESAAAIDATARVSYPNLVCGEGTAFTVNARTLPVGGGAAITVYGRMVKLFDGKIRIENAGDGARAGVSLLRCSAAVGVDLDSFEFVGFPEGTAFAWADNELKVAATARKGLLILIR
ncbi:MAG: hypothetical protein ACI4RD_04345 [Kiritimatiellia bacterium]